VRAPSGAVRWISVRFAGRDVRTAGWNGRGAGNAAAAGSTVRRTCETGVWTCDARGARTAREVACGLACARGAGPLGFLGRGRFVRGPAPGPVTGLAAGAGVCRVAGAGALTATGAGARGWAGAGVPSYWSGVGTGSGWYESVKVTTMCTGPL
jgi:hypothetical protein